MIYLNKVGYMAVVCRWAVAVIEVTTGDSPDHLGRSGEAKNPKNPKRVKCDQWTDGPMDQRTDNAGCRVA